MSLLIHQGGHHIVSDGFRRGVFGFGSLTVCTAPSARQQDPLSRNLSIHMPIIALWQRRWVFVPESMGKGQRLG